MNNTKKPYVIEGRKYPIRLLIMQLDDDGNITHGECQLCESPVRLCDGKLKCPYCMTRYNEDGYATYLGRDPDYKY